MRNPPSSAGFFLRCRLSVAADDKGASSAGAHRRRSSFAEQPKTAKSAESGRHHGPCRRFGRRGGKTRSIRHADDGEVAIGWISDCESRVGGSREASELIAVANIEVVSFVEK